jgi:hypothetical protein
MTVESGGALFSGQRGEWRRCSSHGRSSRTQLTNATPHAKHTHLHPRRRPQRHQAL